MMMQRRDFLAGTLAGAGALLAGRQPHAWAEAFPATHDPYELVSLGKTGIKMLCRFDNKHLFQLWIHAEFGKSFLCCCPYL